MLRILAITNETEYIAKTWIEKQAKGKSKNVVTAKRTKPKKINLHNTLSCPRFQRNSIPIEKKSEK